MKYMISFVVGTLLIGLGLGVTALEVTSLEAKSYPIDQSESAVSTFEKVYTFQAYSSEFNLDIYGNQVEIEFLQDSSMATNQVKVLAHYPSDIADLWVRRYSSHNEDRFAFQLNFRPEFVWDCLQESLEYLKEGSISYPDINNFSVPVQVIVHPSTLALIYGQ